MNPVYLVLERDLPDGGGTETQYVACNQGVTLPPDDLGAVIDVASSRVVARCVWSRGRRGFRMVNDEELVTDKLYDRVFVQSIPDHPPGLAIVMTDEVAVTQASAPDNRVFYAPSSAPAPLSSEEILLPDGSPRSPWRELGRP